jgi:hypothetical protein
MVTLAVLIHTMGYVVWVNDTKETNVIRSRRRVFISDFISNLRCKLH